MRSAAIGVNHGSATLWYTVAIESYDVQLDAGADWFMSPILNSVGPAQMPGPGGRVHPVLVGEWLRGYRDSPCGDLCRTCAASWPTPPIVCELNACWNSCPSTNRPVWQPTGPRNSCRTGSVGTGDCAQQASMHGGPRLSTSVTCHQAGMCRGSAVGSQKRPATVLRRDDARTVVRQVMPRDHGAMRTFELRIPAVRAPVVVWP
jgi:hypothetical protein